MDDISTDQYSEEVPEGSRHGFTTPHCGDLYPMLAAFAGKNTGDGPTDVYVLCFF